MKVIYKITYPNGKIYVGQDRTGSALYFGSPKSALIVNDFTDQELSDFTIRKQILWSSQDCTQAELNAKEVEFIFSCKSNNPAIGYNLRPKMRTDDIDQRNQIGAMP